VPTGIPAPPVAVRRQPRRRRLVALVAVVAVIAAGTYLGVVLTRVHRRPPVAGASTPAFLRQYTVFYTDQFGPRLVPLDGRPASSLMATGSGDPEPPLPVSGGVVFVHRGLAYFLATPAGAQPRALGVADHLFAMIWPGVVGIQRGFAPGPVNVQFVSTTGEPGADSPVWQLPAGYQPLAQAGNGLLLIDGRGELRLWDIAGGQVGPTLGQARSVIDTHGDQIAWRAGVGCVNAECPLHITDADTGADRIVAPPASHAGFLDGGAFSPGGSMLAGFVSAPSGTSPRAELVLIDPVAPFNNSVVRDSVVPFGEPVGSAAWTPDSTTVFFCGLGGPMRVYRLGDRRAVSVNLQSSYNFLVW
jgi:hypothetical protein